MAQNGQAAKPRQNQGQTREPSPEPLPHSISPTQHTHSSQDMGRDRRQGTGLVMSAPARLFSGSAP